MRVRLLADISGTRNGRSWPPRGTVVELPDDEAAQMIRSTVAVAVTDADQLSYEHDRRAYAGFTDLIPGPAPVVAAPGGSEVVTAPPPSPDSVLTTENGPGRRPAQPSKR